MRSVAQAGKGPASGDRAIRGSRSGPARGLAYFTRFSISRQRGEQDVPDDLQAPRRNVLEGVVGRVPRRVVEVDDIDGGIPAARNSRWSSSIGVSSSRNSARPSRFAAPQTASFSQPVEFCSRRMPRFLSPIMSTRMKARTSLTVPPFSAGRRSSGCRRCDPACWEGSSPRPPPRRRERAARSAADSPAPSARGPSRAGRLHSTRRRWRRRNGIPSPAWCRSGRR